MCKREILELIVSAVILFQIQKSDLVVFWGVMKRKVRISDKQRAGKSELDSQPRSGFLKMTPPQVVENTMLGQYYPTEHPPLPKAPCVSLGQSTLWQDFRH